MKNLIKNDSLTATNSTPKQRKSNIPSFNNYLVDHLVVNELSELNHPQQYQHGQHTVDASPRASHYHLRSYHEDIGVRMVQEGEGQREKNNENHESRGKKCFRCHRGSLFISLIVVAILFLLSNTLLLSGGPARGGGYNGYKGQKSHLRSSSSSSSLNQSSHWFHYISSTPLHLRRRFLGGSSELLVDGETSTAEKGESSSDDAPPARMRGLRGSMTNFQDIDDYASIGPFL